MSQEVISTPLTRLLKIQHPVMLAGMNVAAGPELAAAVSNAGGIGVLGGLGYTPKHLRSQIKEIKASLREPSLPFGVDLLIPAVGGTETKSGKKARATNYDYTKGQLMDLIDVIIEEKAALFVCAIGVPPKAAVDKLHAAGIVCANMVGAPKHVGYALDAGVDIIIAQGGEGGGHTGDTPTSILIPACVDACKGKKSPLTGEPIQVVAAGGIYDGRGLAAALCWGASGVWVGTRFVASTEAAAPPHHKKLIQQAGYEDIDRTLIYTGRPLRVFKSEYVENWNQNRRDEIVALTSKGVLPHEEELKKRPEISMKTRPWLMGTVAASISDILPAKTIIDNMVKDARACFAQGSSMSKL